MLAIAAVGQDAVHDLLAGQGRCQTAQQFQVGEAVDEFRACRHIAYAQPAREGLGVAAHQQHALQPVHGGQAQRHVAQVLGVGVVLHQQKVVPLCDAQHLVCHAG
ncbi:hypothetical protein D3C72_1483680 [compost metagenome]